MIYIYIKVKWSLYRPGVAQRVGRGIALLFHDDGNRRGWVISSTPQPHFTPGKDPVPILQEAAWAPGPVWTSEKSRPHRDSIPDRPAVAQSLYRLSYPAHTHTHTRAHIYIYIYVCVCVCMYIYIYIYICRYNINNIWEDMLCTVNVTFRSFRFCEETQTWDELVSDYRPIESYYKVESNR